jgi:hypothetical protein
MRTATPQQVYDIVSEPGAAPALDSINVTAALQRLAKVGAGTWCWLCS